VALLAWEGSAAPLRLGGHKGAVSAVAFSPDGKRLAAAGLEDGIGSLWDVSGLGKSSRGEPSLLHALPCPPLMCDLAFSPDGRRLAGVSRDLVKMWDVGTGHEVLTLRGAAQRNWDPAFNARILFSPDGHRLAATNWDETVSVWEAERATDDDAVVRRQVARRQAADARAAFWHLQEAEDCLRHHNRLAARFHLDRLRRATLPGPLQARRESLVRQLNEPEGKGS
jgi:dipeptidyl aminopeptidase/acylaminoacyl peptidase